MTVQILLATFNSEKHLKLQLDSILAQDYTDIQILIRDGGSTDETLEIIAEYEKKYPGKVVLKESKTANACQNFSRLLELSDADIVMFSDHDDVWMTDKVSRTLQKYKETEEKYGKTTPILVFTDALVVDRKLEVISHSNFQRQNLNPFKTDFSSLVMQNCASGNTMMLNRALIAKACPIPKEAVMHDHYLMLTAAVFGKICLLNEPTLLYRQHTNNVLGATKYGFVYFLKRFCSGRKIIRKRLYCNISQAVIFCHHHKHELPEEIRCFQDGLQNFSDMNFFEKRRFLLKNKVFKTGFLRNFGMFLLI